MKNKFGIDHTNKVQKVKVKNMLTNEIFIFVNDSTLTENIVSHIIVEIKRNTGSLLIQEYREKIKEEAKIKESISTIDQKQFAFSETFDLYARFVD